MCALNNVPLRFATLVGILALSVSCGGHGARPTAPTPPAPPASPPSLTAPNLAGTWTGTASVAWDEIDGGGGCSGPVTVTFAHSGAAVAATLPAVAGCLNEPLRFEGTVRGNALQGSIIFPAFNWPTFGQASEDNVTMRALNVSWDLRR